VVYTNCSIECHTCFSSLSSGWLFVHVCCSTGDADVHRSVIVGTLLDYHLANLYSMFSLQSPVALNILESKVVHLKFQNLSHYPLYNLEKEDGWLSSFYSCLIKKVCHLITEILLMPASFAQEFFRVVSSMRKNM
jgi:hypothetical protein